MKLLQYMQEYECKRLVGRLHKAKPNSQIVSYSSMLPDWLESTQSDSCDAGVPCRGDPDSQETTASCQHCGSNLLPEAHAPAQQEENIFTMGKLSGVFASYWLAEHSQPPADCVRIYFNVINYTFGKSLKGKEKTEKCVHRMTCLIRYFCDYFND